MSVRNVLIETPRTQLCVLDVHHADAIIAYYRDNAAHLNQWEPKRSPDFYSQTTWRWQGRNAQLDFERGTSLRLLAFDRMTGKVAATSNYTQIQRSPFEACTLGFSVGAAHQGTGLMFEVIEAGLNYVFNTMGLHRVMANHLPENKRSAAMLVRLGFEREGYAKAYLQINGVWRDHVLNAKINPAHV